MKFSKGESWALFLLFIFLVVCLIVLFLKLKYDESISPIKNRLVENIRAHHIREANCTTPRAIELVFEDEENKKVIFDNNVLISIDYINENRDVMSSSVWESSFHEAEHGRIKIDPLIFGENDEVYKYSDQDMLTIFWKNRKTEVTRGRVWIVAKGFSYSFELLNMLDLQPSELACCIKLLSRKPEFIERLDSSAPGSGSGVSSIRSKQVVFLIFSEGWIWA